MSTPTASDVSRMILPYGDRRIRFEVRGSPLRTRASVAIHVEPDGRVLVDAPQRASDAQIRAALSRRLAWVHRRLVEVEARYRWLTPREYVSGETALYLGRRYQLKVVDSDVEKGAWLRGSYLEISASDTSPTVVQAELEKWIRKRAREVLPGRIAKVSGPLRWVKQQPPISIRRMSRQWGSCSPKGHIALNVDLMRVPMQCIDYVLLHELIHLKVHNHGRAFYQTLDRHLPDWRRIKHRLDGLAELALAR